MRILLLTKGLDIGGIERIVVDLANGLSRRGHRVDVAVVNDARLRLADQLDGARLISLGGTDRIGARATWRLTRLLRSTPYDVVHVHGPLPSIIARCIPTRCSIITTSHTLWSGLHPATRFAWARTARRDEATIAVSSAVRESLPRPVRARTVVVPHGIDATRARWRPDRGTNDATVRAICVASHRDVKNYPNLLRAFALAASAIPSLHLVAIGDGPDRDRHIALARELGLADRVEFRSATPDVITAMASSDLLVVASDFEGQPLVVSEALAVGLPVVATAVGRVPELVSPAIGRIVPPNDSDRLGHAIIEVASDPELRRSLGEAARSAANRWTLDHALDAHEDVYQLVTRH